MILMYVCVFLNSCRQSESKSGVILTPDGDRGQSENSNSPDRNRSMRRRRRRRKCTKQRSAAGECDRQSATNNRTKSKLINSRRRIKMSNQSKLGKNRQKVFQSR